jgi:hypothetical protein
VGIGWALQTEGKFTRQQVLRRWAAKSARTGILSGIFLLGLTIYRIYDVIGVAVVVEWDNFLSWM